MKNQTAIRNRRLNRRRFSLVEIMVAIGILILMMTFLFEFVISSQRLWSASERKTSHFDDGETVLNVIGTDFLNMQLSADASRYVPFYYNKNATGKTVNGTSQAVALYVMWVSVRPTANNNFTGVEPVAYVWGKTDHKLYRIKGAKIDSAMKSGSTDYRYDYQNLVFTGPDLEDANDISGFAGHLLNIVGAGNTINDDDLIAEDVYSCDINASGTVYSDTTNGWWFSIGNPQSFSIQFGLFDKELIEQQYEEADADEKEKLREQNTRTFSRVFFVN